MSMTRAIVFLLALGACKGSEPSGSSDAVGRCAVALVALGNKVASAAADDPGKLAEIDAMRDYARGCGEVYREAACREAWRSVADTPRAAPSAPRIGPVTEPRTSALASACRDVYCPLLPEPKPGLCAAASQDDAQLTAGWPELHDAIVARDLSDRPELAQAIRRLFTPVVVPVELPDAGPPDPPAQLTVELHAGGELIVDGKPVTDDTRVLELARQARSKDPELRAVIKAESSVTHGRVMRILDLLKQAGISKIAFGVTPTEAL
jgi:biopolymer transport protein ExbD